MCFFVLFLKNKMQHIPVVSHTLCGGTFNLEIVVPATQTCGSYHRRDDVVFIYSGRGASRDRGECRGEVRPKDAQSTLWNPLISKGGWRLLRALQWYLFTNGDGCAWLCWPLQGQCIRESSKGGWTNSGCSVHSVGRAMLVFTLAHLSCCDGGTSACMHHTTLHSPRLGLQATFQHAVLSGLDRLTATRRLHILYKQVIWNAISQRKQIHEKFCL